jgi:hypothetical protein
MKGPNKSVNIGIVTLVSLFVILFFYSPATSAATSKDLQKFQRSIIDYSWKLNPRFKKVKRAKTSYIIVHTSELGLSATLRVISKGKQLPSGRKTHGGHSHYVIARDGRTYRMLNNRYMADHAGLSMWNGETNISKISIGIELVGYHYSPITIHQYRSIGLLLDILQDMYRLGDRNVLTHSQVAYGFPNRWFKKNHRGRKRCAKNFNRAKAGLGPTWRYDPDVRARRLTADPQLAEVFYSRRRLQAKTDEANIVSKSNTAWSIAGEDYDSRSTIYKFPNGRIYRGDQISDKLGWNRIPPKTIVLLNQETGSEWNRSIGPIKSIGDGRTAWSLVGKAYNRRTTIYFLPSGGIRYGSTISNWNDLPAETRIITGYRGPFKIHRNRTAYQIAGVKYRDQETIYYLPTQKLLAGNHISDFKDLPSGTLVFLPSS